MTVFKKIKETKIGTTTFLIFYYALTIIIGILYASESSSLLKSIVLAMLIIILYSIFLLWLISKVIDQKNRKLRFLDSFSVYFSFSILLLLSISGGIISYLSLSILTIIILLQIIIGSKLMFNKLIK